MPTDKELMQQALNALITAELDGNCEYGVTESLRARLAQPEPTMEVTWIDNKQTGNFFNVAPPQREWQELTDEDMRQAAQAMDAEPLAQGWRELVKFARAIEAKLKEKNG